MNEKVRGWLVIFGPLLIVGACSVAGWEIYQDLAGDLDDLPDTTVSQTAAADRMEDIVRGVLGLLPSGARTVKQGETVQHCQIGLEQKQTGQVRVSVEYQVHGLAPERFAGYFEAFEAHARGKGWKAHGGSAQEAFPRFDVDEVFSVGMRTAAGGGLTVSASTGCVWPTGSR